MLLVVTDSRGVETWGAGVHNYVDDLALQPGAHGPSSRPTYPPFSAAFIQVFLFDLLVQVHPFSTPPTYVLQACSTNNISANVRHAPREKLGRLASWSALAKYSTGPLGRNTIVRKAGRLRFKNTAESGGLRGEYQSKSFIKYGDNSCPRVRNPASAELPVCS